MPYTSNNPDIEGGPKRNVVLLVYDKMTESVKAQILRDLLLLSGSFLVSYRDKQGLVDDSILNQIGVIKAEDTAPDDLIIVYKTGAKWPVYDKMITTVERDLCPNDNGQRLDDEPRIGYYLKPQGRNGANLTERYLNRAYPKGKGFVMPWLLN